MLLACTLTAGYQKIFHANPRIGFLPDGDKFQAALDQDDGVHGRAAAPSLPVRGATREAGKPCSRSPAGYGRHGVLHENRFFELAGDLPVVRR